MHMRDLYCEQRAGAVRVSNDLMGQRTNTAKLNWLVHNVGSYGIIVHSLSDRACVVWFDYRIGYLATPVSIESLHRRYMFFTHRITNNN